MLFFRIVKFIRGVLKTGQTYSNHQYDDGYYQKGLPKYNDRFVDNQDGTITDKITGLMWVKEVSALGAPFNAVMNWESALNNCESLVYAGHSDWRAPNINEIQTLIDFGRANPSINTVFFPNTPWEGFWSSSALSTNGWLVWCISFADGYRFNTGQDSNYYVRPVRNAF
ncbi:MAG: DUF1566 domain-containing protein [Candidatus Omnitrophota bacterium]